MSQIAASMATGVWTLGIPRPRAPAGWLLVAAGLAAGLTALAVAVAGASVPSADLSVAQAIQSVDFFGWDAALDLGEIVTGAPVGVLVWFALVAGLWLWGRPVEAIVVGLAPGIWVPKTILEELVARPRPSEELLTVSQLADGYSFPSGHVTAGVAVLGVLAVIAVVRSSDWRGRAWVMGPVAGLLALAALSRVASGAHWPSDVLAGFLLGGVWLIALAWIYTMLRRDEVPLPGWRLLKRALPRRRAVAPDGVRLAGSIASTVYLDDAAGTAVKVYRPSRPVRLLYWAAFQAPFPYSAREEALRTAAAIREVTGLLTHYWTGADMVAAVREIHREGCELHFVTELVHGEEPPDNAAILPQLRTLQRRFAAAGLPTWQIDPENPHAHTNFIRTPDGQLKIIDLESTLVPVIQPLHTLPQMLRAGRLPAFDDVDYDRLRRYVDAEAAGLQVTLGPADFARLQRALADAERYSAAWKSQEPNLWGRAAQKLWQAFAVERRVDGIRRRLSRAEDYAMAFVAKPLDRWVAEGRVSQAEADQVHARLQGDATRQGMRHLGIAVAVSIPLRFPFGSLTRFALVLSFRYRAGRQYANDEISAADFRQARETHTWLVAAVALIPGLGAGAYLLSPTLRRSGNLIPLAADQALYKLPFGLYGRLRLGRLMPSRLGLPRARSAAAAPALAGSAPAASLGAERPVPRASAPAMGRATRSLPSCRSASIEGRTAPSSGSLASRRVRAHKPP